MSWYLEAWKKYAVFSGRARRKEYWFSMLFHVIFVLVILAVDFIIVGADQTGVAIFSTILGLAFILPGLGLVVRRLHDTGRSGWWYFIGVVPIIGAIVLLVFLFQDSELGENKYGPNPKMVSAN